MISYSCMRVDVVRLGVHGEGIFSVPVGKNKDKIGFVDFVLPGESADIEITQDKSKFCRAKLIDLCSKSANRVVPKCKYFGVCGGCDLQHMDKLLQTEFKKKLILDVVQKFGYSSDIEIVCGEPLGYRNKMVFPFDCSKDKITLGMFKKNSHEVVDIDECLIAKSGINKVLDFCKKYFDTNNKLFEKCKNELKYLVVREVEHKFLITLVCGRKIDLSDFCDRICNAFDVLGVYMNISDKNTYYSFYAHLSCKCVKTGQVVRLGTVIGKSGISGNASNLRGEDEHVHLEYRIVPKSGRGHQANPNAIVRTKFYSADPKNPNQSKVRVVKR